LPRVSAPVSSMSQAGMTNLLANRQNKGLFYKYFHLVAYLLLKSRIL
jgi:hypothetical protein